MNASARHDLFMVMWGVPAGLGAALLVLGLSDGRVWQLVAGPVLVAFSAWRAVAQHRNSRP